MLKSIEGNGDLIINVTSASGGGGGIHSDAKNRHKNICN